jgi:hypothetical protein
MPTPFPTILHIMAENQYLSGDDFVKLFKTLESNVISSLVRSTKNSWLSSVLPHFNPKTSYRISPHFLDKLTPGEPQLLKDYLLRLVLSDRNEDKNALKIWVNLCAKSFVAWANDEENETKIDSNLMLVLLLAVQKSFSLRPEKLKRELEHEIVTYIKRTHPEAFKKDPVSLPEQQAKEITAYVLNKLNANFEYRLSNDPLSDLNQVEFVSNLMTEADAEQLKTRLQELVLNTDSTQLRVVESRTAQGQYRVVFYDPVSTHLLLQAMQSLLNETLFSPSSLKAQTHYESSTRGLYWTYNWGAVEYMPATFTSTEHQQEYYKTSSQIVHASSTLSTMFEMLSILGLDVQEHQGSRYGTTQIMACTGENFNFIRALPKKPKPPISDSSLKNLSIFAVRPTQTTDLNPQATASSSANP